MAPCVGTLLDGRGSGLFAFRLGGRFLLIDNLRAVAGYGTMRHARPHPHHALRSRASVRQFRKVGEFRRCGEEREASLAGRVKQVQA